LPINNKESSPQGGGSMRIDPSGVVRSDAVNVSAAVDKVLNNQQEMPANNSYNSDVKLDKSPSREDLQDVLDVFKKKLEKFKLVVNTEAEFKIDRDTGMIVVKIKDKDTGEVIRQIPPEVMVKLAKTIDEFLGLLFDERV